MEKFTYLHSQNLAYIEALFESFLKSPDAVDPEWRMFFEGVEFAKRLGGGAGSGISAKDLKVYDLVRAYRSYGHRKANLDPLKLMASDFNGLELNQFGLEEKDLNTNVEIAAHVGLPKAKLKDLITKLQSAYCGTLTAEFADTPLPVQKWFIRELEQDITALSPQQKQAVYGHLVKAEGMERFIHTRFVGAKRFSLEGGDSLIPMLELLLEKGSQTGVQEIVLGMAHRGRLNVLTNFLGKDIALVFSEFDGVINPMEQFGDGDVKYHNGYSSDRKTAHGDMHLSLAFNPSHLEAVDPVVLGAVRAKQKQRKDSAERKRVISVLVHGDAAFIGQGVVTESLQLSKLEGYTVGGTIHIVVNNQVGFTTSPEYARSSFYCTDIAKALQAPVLHVNGDDVEACARAMEIAFKYRQQFGQDVVIELVCYRRFGHNEGDEPAFTQPVMYNAIKNHPTPREVYAQRLEQENVLSKADADLAITKELDRLQAILDKARKETVVPRFFTLEGTWKGLRRAQAQDWSSKTETRVSAENLRALTDILTSAPQGFTVHPKLQKQLESRRKMLDTNAVDWGMGELLAYGSLLKEGTSVRLAGQDVGRGTFTHRHAIFHDAQNGKLYSPLDSISDKTTFEVVDSCLSEYACLGFEYGYSLAEPRALTIWEAQFGDFANSAQIIIDQFLSSAESKWQRMSGLVLLLPHGYEGQGPEHSSARLERFLQLCAQDNMQVCNFTTPAQLFHAMRRQMKREFRKPLVVMSPKSLLRHPKVISSLEDFTNGTFAEVLPDLSIKDASKVQRLVFCSGKISYELDEERIKQDKDGTVAIIRVEQLYPFPAERLLEVVKGFTNVKQVIWAQEEPRNMGAWLYIAERLRECLKEFAARGANFRYVGRTERASPAIGNPKLHANEQSDIIKGCFQP